MATYTGFSNRFNAGELAPDAWSDSDLEQYAHGCAVAQNYIADVAGPLKRRPGFRFAGLTKLQTVAGATVLIEFKRSPESAFMLEIGALYGRIWNPDGSPLLNAGVPVGFVHAWTQGQLAGLRWVQSGDVLYVTSKDGLRPRRIKHVSDTSWVIDDLSFRRGPWRQENADPNLTLACSGCTGAGLTLTASAAVFVPSHVGTTFRLRGQITGAGVAGWSPASDVGAAYTLMESNGRIYRDLSGFADPDHQDTGSNPPVHDRGVASDGKSEWEYVHNGAGIVLVTGYTDATHVTVTAITTLPGVGTATGAARTWAPGANPAFDATPFWQEAAYSDYRGWPTAWPGLNEERLYFAGGASEPDTFNATNTDGFDADGVVLDPTFGTGQVLDTDPIRRFSGNRGGRVVWFASTLAFFCGTTAGEVLLTGAALGDAVTPSSTRARDVTDFGADDCRPAVGHTNVLYVVRGGARLRELVIDAYQQTNTGKDLTLLASHISKRGLAQIVWDATRNLLWARLADGGLAAFQYDVDNKVYGWTQQTVGDGSWRVESLAILPGYGGFDVLWISASRSKSGRWQRALFTLADRADGVFLDAFETYAGPPVNQVGGLDHLDGERVTALADGAQYDNLFVQAGGLLTLPAGIMASSVAAGQPYESLFQSLPLDLGGPGLTQGKRTRLTQGLVSLVGVEAFVGSDVGELDHVIMRGDDEGLTLVPKRLIEKVTFAGGAGRDPRVVVKYAGGFDLEIHALKPMAEANG